MCMHVRVVRAEDARERKEKKERTRLRSGLTARSVEQEEEKADDEE